MEYTINKLAKLAAISTRTLRYYDECKLLTPARINSNGYRIYGQKEVDRLQQILFYRELGVPLEEIRRILSSRGFEEEQALKGHLSALLSKRNQLDVLIANVEKTILASKGEIIMSDKEKFQGFMDKMVRENEEKHGKEIREKYGDQAVDQSNAKLKGMKAEEYEELESLRVEVNETLKKAFEMGDPAGEVAQKACELHRKWLCHYWEHYSKEAHVGIGQMYVEDPRFSAYYDSIAPGCAVFLRDALLIYCK